MISSHTVEVVRSDHINKSIVAIAIDDTISVIGLINGLTRNFNIAKRMTEQIKLQGINVGSKEMFTRINVAIEVNSLNPVIDKVYAFEQAKEALTRRNWYFQ